MKRAGVRSTARCAVVELYKDHSRGSMLALVARRRLDLDEPVAGMSITYAICCNNRPPDVPTTVVCENTTLPWLPVRSHGPAMSFLNSGGGQGSCRGSRQAVVPNAVCIRPSSGPRVAGWVLVVGRDGGIAVFHARHFALDICNTPSPLFTGIEQ